MKRRDHVRGRNKTKLDLHSCSCSGAFHWCLLGQPGEENIHLVLLRRRHCKSREFKGEELLSGLDIENYALDMEKRDQEQYENGNNDR